MLGTLLQKYSTCPASLSVAVGQHRPLDGCCLASALHNDQLLPSADTNHTHQSLHNVSTYDV